MSRSTPNSPRREQPARAAAQHSPYASTSGRTGAGPHSQPRKRNGCLTCRIRRKNCSDRMLDVQPNIPCSNCRSLCIECLGYSEKRPRWMQDSTSDVVGAMRVAIKGFTRPFTQPTEKGFFSLSRYYRKDPSFIPSFPIEGSLELYKTPLQNDDVKDEDDSSGTSDRDDNETPSTSTTFTPYRTDIFSLLPDQHSFTQSNDFLSPDIPPIGRASHRPLPPPLTVTPSAPPRLSSDDEQSQASSPAEPQSPTSFENMLMFPPNMTLPQQIHPPMALPPNIITSIMRPSANYFAPSAAIDESGVVTRVPTVPHPHYHQSQPCVQYGVMAPPHPLARNDEPHLSEMTHTFPYAMMYSLPPSGADHHADPGSAFPSVFNGDAGMSGAQYSWPVSRHQPPW